ncbi:MAG: hypothetical protein H0X15_08715 [Acidobacteria bacterium]|nr:hypothetical protein [Acidobacteriota bacterium]MBA4124105.1 hypothetical protein [Acidobacteriota bacterium]MBA4185848.1 hypothetical protein [Acidobacteriota bacterium]
MIISWKLIENFEIPRLERNKLNIDIQLEVLDYVIAQALQTELIQKGLNNISVDATTTEVILRGTVPKGKMAEAVRTALEVEKRKVNNKLTEQ